MTNNELKFPEWQRPLQNLVLEFDSEKLPEKIQEVEALMLERLQQLPPANDGEREAINDGLGIIRLLKRDKLGLGASKFR